MTGSRRQVPVGLLEDVECARRRIVQLEAHLEDFERTRGQHDRARRDLAAARRDLDTAYATIGRAWDGSTGKPVSTVSAVELPADAQYYRAGRAIALPADARFVYGPRPHYGLSGAGAPTFVVSRSPRPTWWSHGAALVGLLWAALNVTRAVVRVAGVAARTRLVRGTAVTAVTAWLLLWLYAWTPSSPVLIPGLIPGW